MAEYQFSLYISHAKMMHRRAEAIVALQNENMCLYAEEDLTSFLSSKKSGLYIALVRPLLMEHTVDVSPFSQYAVKLRSSQPHCIVSTFTTSQDGIQFNSLR